MERLTIAMLTMREIHHIDGMQISALGFPTPPRKQRRKQRVECGLARKGLALGKNLCENRAR
ncbi:hypothetical protein [Allorhizobium taibaishanense]|uniref:Uncharacterized protein n=1 Tax=Allorhizobium taibaishanense TaxID=887144 RepID=A0A7W6MU99_9HYPH|nr:hypothetical protein [Allorhizobium taibaishanense]MBB4007925.1 hypothetical protein [Allorhizobium taibaishanense]